MKSSLAIVNKRRDDIISYLKSNPKINNEQLANLLNTSTLTIRRDLQYLEEKGIVRRHYGGATIISQEEDIELVKSEIVKSNDDLNNKERIAKCAAEIIEDGDIIFINSSTTALSILNYVGDKNIVVVTNNCNILAMDIPQNVEVMMTGGQINFKNQSMVGDFAAAFLQNISVSKCFIGVSGIDYKTGISTVFMQETYINKEMIRQTGGDVFIVAESYKVFKTNNFSSGSIDQIQYFITDNELSDHDAQGFIKAGVSVITV